MTPIKQKELIEEFCLLNGYSLEKEGLVITESFKELRRHMEEMDRDFVHMAGLGDFFMKIWSVARGVTSEEKIKKGYEETVQKRKERGMVPSASTFFAIKEHGELAEKLKVVWARLEASYIKRKADDTQKKKDKKGKKDGDKTDCGFEEGVGEEG